MPESASALSKARAYCARQERCQQEVRDKLYTWQTPAREIEGIISRLIGEGFINEARYAEHYAVSKARQKGWGSKKIEQALRLKGVSEPCIRLGLKAIDLEEARDELKKAVERRMRRVNETDPFVKQQKVIQYFMRKGHSHEAVAAAMKLEDQ